MRQLPGFTLYFQFHMPFGQCECRVLTRLKKSGGMHGVIGKTRDRRGEVAIWSQKSKRVGERISIGVFLFPWFVEEVNLLISWLCASNSTPQVHRHQSMGGDTLSPASAKELTSPLFPLPNHINIFTGADFSPLSSHERDP